jgi:molybdopterin synthase catalytic subunit
MAEIAGDASHMSEDGCYVGLTHDHLDVKEVMDLVRSPAAGAIVLFAGAHTQWGADSLHLNMND